MKKFENVIGIDFSEEKLDVNSYLCQKENQFNNTPEGHQAFFKWFKSISKKYQGDQLVCFEHTGICTLNFMDFLEKKSVSYSVRSPYEIKHSMGIKRGKSDKIDARDIAEYAYLRRDTLPLYTLPSKQILKLKPLLTLRQNLIGNRAGLKTCLKSSRNHLPAKMHKELHEYLSDSIKKLSSTIKKIEADILKLIKEDPQLHKLYELITSIKSVGPVIASSFLVYTNCFQAFDDPRKFSCYAGAAPFDNSSGKTIRKKRVNHMANKRMKSLLTMAAFNAINYNPELRSYYKKRIKEGKNEMSTINIIRNKIISRVFAVVKRGTPYVDTMKYAT